jgi:pimeloyl-ACP methyl ester carboxylesterase
MAALRAWGRGNGDRRDYLKKIIQPALVINGRDDIMIPTVNSFILQQELPNAQLLLFPDSGHGAIFQFPKLTAQQAGRFLD